MESTGYRPIILLINPIQETLYQRPEILATGSRYLLFCEPNSTFDA